MGGEAGALPEGVVAYRTTAIFTESSIPQGLLHAHRTAAGVWGLIEVLEGQLLFRVPGLGIERMLAPGCAPGVTEPGVLHEVALAGPVRFHITFHRRPGPVEGTARKPEAQPDAGPGASREREGAGNVGSDVPPTFA